MPKWMKKAFGNMRPAKKRGNKSKMVTAVQKANNHRPPAMDVDDPCPLCGGKLVLYWSQTQKRITCVKCDADWRA